MKRFLLVALAALMSIASASAQNTSITVTKVYSDVTQTPLASFRFCLTPVGASGQPQAFTSSGGGQVLSRVWCYTGTNGAVSGISVPDTSLASPSGVGYLVSIQALNGVTLQNYSEPIHPSGATWSF